MTITRKSTYDECVTEINLCVQDWVQDQPELAAEAAEDELWLDMARSVLMDADPRVAREVFRCELGWVPQGF